MTITVERMVAVLEARVDQFEKNVNRARGVAVTDFAAITAAGNKMEASLGRLGAGGRKGFDSLSKSVNSLKGQTGNLAAQFNDIGVQLAGGQNPFLIAIQQGSQITQVLGQAGARGAVSALGGAMLSLLNPVSLATIALIGLGGTAIQYFTSLISEGEASEKVLKEQADLIQRVAERWGEAVPALREYVEELKRAQEVADLQEAMQIKVAEAVAEAKSKYGDFADEFTNILVILKAAAADPQAPLHDLAKAFETLEQKIRDGTVEAKDFQSAQAAAASAAATTGYSDIITFSDAFTTLSGRIATALSSLGQFKSQVANVVNTAAAIQEKLQNIIQQSSFVDNNGNVRSPSEFIPRNLPTPDNRPPIELEGLPGTGGGKSSAANQYQSATQSMKERTDALQAQLDVQQKLNPLLNDYGYSLEFAKAKQELLTAAEKSNKAVTPELAAEIDNIAAAYARTTAELSKLAEENKKAAEAVQFQKDLVNGALSDMRSALEDGKLTWQDLGNVAVNVLNKIADRLQQMLVDQLFAKGLGGLFGSFLGLGGSMAGVAGAGAAGIKAASVSPATAMNAAKLPAAAAQAKAQAVAVDVRTYVDENGNWQSKVEQISGGVSAQAVKAGFARYRAGGVQSDIARFSSNPRRR